jgi:hypothetical protein
MKKGNRRFEGLFLVCLVAGMMLAYAACGDDEPSQVCDPGSTQDCSCGGGRIGSQTCESTGLAWGTCENCDCTPNCAGRECGPDPECGALCGTCPVGDTCTASGTCDSSLDCPADRDCAGRECGPDPICRVSCGTCSGSEECNASGVCVLDCVSNCSGRECGWDPVCGTLNCGSCSGTETCNIATGMCEGCVPSCTGRECGLDPVCGTLNCGSCSGTETCNSSGMCVPGTPTWDATRCSSYGGYWAALNLDSGGSGSGCWFAASTENVSCTSVCSGYGLSCRTDNWNDNSSNSICLHFFPSHVGDDPRNNPQGGPTPALITLTGTSEGCVYRCPLGHDNSGFEGCAGAGDYGYAQDCSARAAYEQRICVCEP